MRFKVETFEELAKIVAEEFFKEMTENEFATFEEMAEIFWWTPEEIKDEVDAIIQDATDNDACIDEIDRTDVLMHGTDLIITYRKFSAMWRKELKEIQEGKR